MRYEEWILRLEEDFRENIDPDRIYTSEEKYKEISAFMRTYVQYELPKYKGGGDYSALWRMIEDRLKKISTQMRGQSEKEIAKNNALVNEILVKEHVKENAHVYDAE
jgi:hypothetical protein